MLVPPVAVVYQLILFPVEIAFKVAEAPLQTEVGLAVTTLATVGNAEMVILPDTLLVNVPPLELLTTQ